MVRLSRVHSVALQTQAQMTEKNAGSVSCCRHVPPRSIGAPRTPSTGARQVLHPAGSMAMLALVYLDSSADDQMWDTSKAMPCRRASIAAAGRAGHIPT